MEIGQKIKDARIAKGLTQEELGNIVGVQKSAVAKWENGRVQNIKRRTLQKLADTLGLRGSDLIIGNDPEGAAQITMNVLENPEIIELICKYNGLSAQDKKTVIDLINRLSD